MVDRKLLLADMQKQVKVLEKDLREQAESVEEVRGRLRGDYDRAFKIALGRRGLGTATSAQVAAALAPALRAALKSPPTAPPGLARRPTDQSVRRYERDQPGELIQVDCEAGPDG